MEQTNNAKARYIPTRVAVCKRCEGKGVVFEYNAMRTGQRYPDPANVRPASDPAE